jgi:hypothetical protein
MTGSSLAYHLQPAHSHRRAATPVGHVGEKNGHPRHRYLILDENPQLRKFSVPGRGIQIVDTEWATTHRRLFPPRTSVYLVEQAPGPTRPGMSVWLFHPSAAQTARS